jgi:hypothetical protein
MFSKPEFKSVHDQFVWDMGPMGLMVNMGPMGPPLTRADGRTGGRADGRTDRWQTGGRADGTRMQ